MRGPMVSGVINQLLTTTDWYAKPIVDTSLNSSDAHKMSHTPSVQYKMLQPIYKLTGCNNALYYGMEGLLTSHNLQLYFH
jgi:hypothetical protein